jgi:hypothetical protein
MPSQAGGTSTAHLAMHTALFTDVEFWMAADRFRVEHTLDGTRLQLTDGSPGPDPLTNRYDVERLLQTACDRGHSFTIEVPSHARTRNPHDRGAR